jgi:hypothetical protein
VASAWQRTDADATLARIHTDETHDEIVGR